MLLLLLFACTGEPTPEGKDSSPGPGLLDVDKDGFTEEDGDCDDNDGGINPSAIEICDGIDNNCDSVVDEGVTATAWADGDNDGFGDSDNPIEACSTPTGYVTNANDCDDTNEAVYPGNQEICDGVDNDCDVEIDEDLSRTWYLDADADSYGTTATTAASCEQPVGYVADNTDCDDSDGTISPAGVESCDGRDNDCDSATDEDATDAITWYIDYDGDGYGGTTFTFTDCEAPAGYVDNADDCDDSSAGTFPGATEVCDGQDNDCDGSSDEDAIDASTWYLDSDGDSYGTTTAVAACDAPAGYVENADDCDDTTANISPADTEICDGLDNNCNGSIDDGAIDAQIGYADTDGDGYGGTTAIEDCTLPSGYVSNSLDCDDADADSFPGGIEVCDGRDNDCNGSVDDSAIDASTWYIDYDGDSFGSLSYATDACDAPAGYVANADDCDDGDMSSFPGGTEVCDDADNDCDGDIDEDAVDTSTWYIDNDGDNYGDAAGPTAACDQPVGYVDNTDDCDDDSAAVSPISTEICDGIDNNCDGDIDTDAIDTSTWYIDDDSDGYGDPSGFVTACDLPVGYTDNADDCDDTAAAISPAATEVCDGIDNDCDGGVDETGTNIWYLDNDGDGFGQDSAVTACDQPDGYADNADDCDDTNVDVFPEATEVCDGEDNDCDGSIDEDTGDASTWYLDYDGDGYGGTSYSVTACDQPDNFVANNDDCNDATAAASPVGTEACDGIDNDCDGATDESVSGAPTWYRDADSDTFGDPDLTTTSCTQPTGYVSDDTDCDDTDATIAPDMDEVCGDGIDNDCTGGDEACDISYSGTWTLDDRVNYSCAYGLVRVNFSSLTIVDSYPTLIISSSGSQPGTMSGSFTSDVDFSVTHVLSGTCTETYTLSGSFTDANTFSATFTASFSGGAWCFDCRNQVWSVVGTL